AKLDRRQVAGEAEDGIELRRDHGASLPVHEPHLAAVAKRRDAVGEIAADMDDDTSRTVDITPILVEAHGGETLVKGKHVVEARGRPIERAAAVDELP